jgi:O-antigen/teichoic acid export membrane protein
MQSKSNRLAKNSAFLYFRTFVQLIITLYTTRIVLSGLGIDDFGIYSVIGGVISMFAFINSALSASVQRFLSYEIGKKNIDKISIVFSTSKNIHHILSLILFVIAEIAGIWFLYHKMNIPTDRLNVGFWVLQASIFVLVLNVLIVPYNASIIAHEDFTMFAYVGILDVVLKFILAIAISLFTNNRLVIYAFGILVISLFVLIIYKKFCFSKYEECKVNAKLDKDVFKEMFSFAGWQFLGAFSQVCKNQGITILLNIFGGVAVNAAQGITNQVNSAITNFVSNFSAALNPQIIKSYSSKNEVYFNKLIHTGSKISFILMSIVILPLILEVNYILNLWLKEVPAYTVNFVVLILIASMINTWTAPISTAIGATGQIKAYILFLSLNNILALPISYLFLRIGWNFTVVYTILIVVNLLNTFIVLYLTQKMLSLNPFFFIKNVILPISIVIIISTIILFIIQSFFTESFFRLLGICFFSTILLVMQYYFIVFSKDEKNLLKQMVTNIRNK